MVIQSSTGGHWLERGDSTTTGDPVAAARLHPNGDFEVTNPWGETWVTHPPGRLREVIPPPPGDDPDEESPLQRHRDDFERALGAQQRFYALIETAKRGRAVASLVLLPARAA